MAALLLVTSAMLADGAADAGADAVVVVVVLLFAGVELHAPRSASATKETSLMPTCLSGISRV